MNSGRLGDSRHSGCVISSRTLRGSVDIFQRNPGASSAVRRPGRGLWCPLGAGVRGESGSADVPKQSGINGGIDRRQSDGRPSERHRSGRLHCEPEVRKPGSLRMESERSEAPDSSRSLCVGGGWRVDQPEIMQSG